MNEMLYHWLGWISTILCIILLLKYVGRISKNKTLNLKLRKVHQPFGIAVIAVSTIHGIISIFKTTSIIDNATGIVLWIAIIGLWWSFYARKKLKAKWFKLHRILSIMLLGLVILHIVVATF